MPLGESRPTCHQLALNQSGGANQVLRKGSDEPSDEKVPAVYQYEEQYLER
jgi:hypothetical protein